MLAADSTMPRALKLPPLSGPDLYERLVELRLSLPSATTGLASLAKELPAHVASFSNEVALELSRLARALRLHEPTIPADVAQLVPSLRLHWRRTQLCCGGDASWLVDASDDELGHVLADWPLAVPSPLPVLRRCLAARDVRLRRVVLRQIARCLSDLTLTGAEAVALLVALAADPEQELRAAAVDLLGAPWLFFLSPSTQRQRSQAVEKASGDPSGAVVRMALKSAAALGMRTLVGEVFADEAREVGVREAALRALATTGDEKDIEAILRMACEDSVSFGGAARHTLLRFHRRGAFIRSTHLPMLLVAFDRHAKWTADELVRVTYLVRAELLERLQELPANDPRWRRRASILAAAYGTGAERLLERRLTECSDATIAGAFVDAAGASAEYVGHDELLPLFSNMPERVLRALRVKGNADCVPWLTERALMASTPSAIRQSAIDVLWALAPDREALQRSLCTRLGPRESKLYARARPIQDQRVAGLLAEAPWPAARDAEPLGALARLQVFAESGDPGRRGDVVREFRAAYLRSLGRSLAGDFSAKRIELPELEQQLYRYGRRLIDAGYPVRRWLEASPETGRDFVLQVACEWLREKPEDATCVALLETIGRQRPTGPVLRFVEGYWRHGNPGVQRAAIEAILSSPEAHGLELSVSQLSVKASDPRVLVQALRGIGALGAGWAAPLAARCLEHANMSVKKEAAAALGVLEPPRAHAPAIAEQIVKWLSVHDNPGFRDALKRALEQVAGRAAIAWLVLSAEASDEPRAMSLLCDAMSGVIRMETVLLLARDGRLPELVDSCVRGETRVLDATKAEVVALLHRALPRSPPVDPDETAVHHLRVHGFSADAAARALEEFSKAPRSDSLEAGGGELLEIVRNALAEWLRWQATLAEPMRSDAASLVLSATAQQAQSDELEEALLACAEALVRLPRSTALNEHDALDEHNALDARTGLWASRLLDFAQHRADGSPSTRRRLLAMLRKLPTDASVDGLRRFELLDKLGAVRDRRDLWASLRQVAVGSDHTRAHDLLIDALGIPAERVCEPDSVARLREQVATFYALTEDEQERWLNEQLEAYPIDVRRLPHEPRAPRARQPSTLEDLRGLEAALKAEAKTEAGAAATSLLAWENARDTWPAVLAAYLEGAIDVPPERRTQLAVLITDWPVDLRQQRRAKVLIGGFAQSASPLHAELHRRLIKQWLGRLAAGDPSVAELLRDAGDRLLPFVAEACAKGDMSLLWLLRPSTSLGPFIEEVGVDRPEVAHLLVDRSHQEDVGEQLGDPLEGMDEVRLVALIRTKDTSKGLAVRAVHALARMNAVDALEGLTLDRRPAVRSAALRTFQRLVDKERGFAASLAVLEIESRGDVVFAILRRLAHGHYAPALPVIVERLSDHDSHIRQHARRAILAWGSAALDGLARAASKARPDRRSAILQVIAELEQSERDDERNREGHWT